MITEENNKSHGKVLKKSIHLIANIILYGKITADDSITVEIRHETPLTSSRITEDSLPVSSIPSTAPNARDQDYEPACPADPKKLSLSNIYKLMHEKEKGPGPELSADTS